MFRILLLHTDGTRVVEVIGFLYWMYRALLGVQSTHKLVSCAKFRDSHVRRS
jgi:hypothetical protein